MEDIKSTAVIIGAGPSGLAMAASLKHAGLDFVLLEKEDEMATTWKNHYDRLCLHTAKSESYLPFTKFDSELPEFVPRKDFVNYLEKYISTHQLKAQTACEVTRISKLDKFWKVESENDSWITPYVIVATGFCRIPNKFQVEGLQNSSLQIIPAQQYKNPNIPVQCSGKKVLVIGMGNSGAEIALDLAENNVGCSVSVRSTVNRIHRELFGRPSQLSSIMLSKFPKSIAYPISSLVQKLTVKDLSEYGLHSSSTPPLKQLFEEGKTPILDLGTGEMIRQGKIKVFPSIKKVNDKQVQFSNGLAEDFDVLIDATGYRNGLDSLIADWSPALERDQPNLKWKYTEHPGLYFLGFDARLNGQLRAIRIQSELITNEIFSQL